MNCRYQQSSVSLPIKILHLPLRFKNAQKKILRSKFTTFVRKLTRTCHSCFPGFIHHWQLLVCAGEASELLIFLFNFLLSLLLPVIFVNVQLFPLHINLKRVYPSVDVWALFWSEFLLTKTVQYVDYRNTVAMDANTACTLTRIPSGDYYTVNVLY